MFKNEIHCDFFAGVGGASVGIEAALQRPLDYAINHDAKAIAAHRANHPGTTHLTADVFSVNPEVLAANRPVGLAWFSPDCTYHSNARGGKPFRDVNLANRKRGLCNVIPRWASTKAAPRLVFCENVVEIMGWTRINPDGRPDRLTKGHLFRRWCQRLEQLGYRIDMRELRACDYGAPTTRKRLFIIMRRDRGEIVFPAPTHGVWDGSTPYKTAAECIDWSLPCPSIFERKKPLAETTMRRIARGIEKYVFNDPTPFIVGIDNKSNGPRDVWSSKEPIKTITTENRFALVQAFLAKYNVSGPTQGHTPSVGLPGYAAGGPASLTTSHLLKFRNNCVGQSMRQPVHTVSAQGMHFGEVRAFLLKYYGTDQNPGLRRPLDVITTKDRFGLVMVYGSLYQIVDIGLRMLTPRELFLAQGFPASYIIDHGVDEDGTTMPLTRGDQVMMCGNSVSPPVAYELVRANLGNDILEAAA